MGRSEHRECEIHRVPSGCASSVLAASIPSSSLPTRSRLTLSRIASCSRKQNLNRCSDRPAVLTYAQVLMSTHWYRSVRAGLRYLARAACECVSDCVGPSRAVQSVKSTREGLAAAHRTAAIRYSAHPEGTSPIQSVRPAGEPPAVCYRDSRAVRCHAMRVVSGARERLRRARPDDNQHAGTARVRVSACVRARARACGWAAAATAGPASACGRALQ